MGQEIRQKIDPEGKIYQDIAERMENYLKLFDFVDTLFDFARTEGKNILYGRYPYNNSKNLHVSDENKLITAAEIINDLVNTGKMKIANFDQNMSYNPGAEHFGVILNGLFRAFSDAEAERPREEILGAIEDIYDAIVISL